MTGGQARGLRLWTPAVAMLLCSLISYIDRNALALLAPTILADCGLTAEQYGWILSAFAVAYMAGNPLWGRWLDRSGVRRGMTVAVGLWTAASASHAFLSGFAGFAAARALLGFGEGATFPGGLRTVVQTLPEGLRSRGAALAYSGGSLGAVLTPIILTPVYLAYGWRAAFLFTGVVGLLWLILWSRVSRRPELRAPHVHPAAGQARIRWRDRRLWAFLASYALGCLPLAFVMYQAPLYFSRALGDPQAEIGRLLWIPPLGWECGYFFFGWLADRLTRGREDPVPVFRWLALVALAGTAPLAFGARIRSFAAAAGAAVLGDVHRRRQRDREPQLRDARRLLRPRRTVGRTRRRLLVGVGGPGHAVVRTPDGSPRLGSGLPAGGRHPRRRVSALALAEPPPALRRAADAATEPSSSCNSGVRGKAWPRYWRKPSAHSTPHSRPRLRVHSSIVWM